MTLARGATVDTLLELEDGAAAITATEVNSGGILDLGDANVHGEIHAHVSAMATATADELYTIHLQGSLSPTFAADVAVLATLGLGDATNLGDVDNDQGVGFYKVPFNNEMAGIQYRYVRLKVTVVGAGSPSVTYVANIHKPVR